MYTQHELIVELIPFRPLMAISGFIISQDIDSISKEIETV